MLITKLEKIKAEHANFTYNYHEQLSHDEVMGVHRISDVYIMLHRLSIFDFATLEAMSQKSAIVLSNVGGNKDFNVNNNVILVDDDYDEAAKQIVNLDLKKTQELNYEIYLKYFSYDMFRSQYLAFVKKLE